MKLSKGSICCIGILATVVLACISFHTLIRDGYARDAGILVPSIVNALIWASLLICCVAFIGFLLCFKISDRKRTKQIVIGVLVGVILLGVGSNLAWTISFHHAQNADTQYENMTAISLEELSATLDDEEREIVYIGRDNCPLCEHIIPDLLSYLTSQNLHILYYNTARDRDINHEKMEQVLEKIPVTEVPFVMIVEERKIVAKFSGEQLVDEFREYMEK